jgi:hypothetical protein
MDHGLLTTCLAIEKKSVAYIAFRRLSLPVSEELYVQHLHQRISFLLSAVTTTVNMILTFMYACLRLVKYNTNISTAPRASTQSSACGWSNDSSQPTVCCDENIPSDGFTYDVMGELAEAFRQAKEEWETVNPVYCPDHTCSAFVTWRLCLK